MIALYADDCKTLRVIHVHTIMNHLVKISIIWPPELKEIKWTLIQRNLSYCRSLKKQCPISAPLLLDGTPLAATSEFSDVDLVTDSKLYWNSHIDKVTSKANKVLGFLKRNCRDLRDISTLRTLFCVLYGHPLLPEILRCSKECDVELQSLF